MDGLKDKLPFRNLFSCHYAILIKIILTRYLILDETKKISNQIYKKISNSFNIKKIMAEFSCQENIEQDLLKGYKLFENILQVLNYYKERGIEEKKSDAILLFEESFELLKAAFKELDILN